VRGRRHRAAERPKHGGALARVATQFRSPSSAIVEGSSIARIGMAVAVLIDATIIRGILLPASMKLLGDWNWYLRPGSSGCRASARAATCCRRTGRASRRHQEGRALPKSHSRGAFPRRPPSDAEGGFEPRWFGSVSGLQESRDALPCYAEALRNLLHRQALGVERVRLGSAYVRSTGVERL
jgi:hypothetical protein